MGRRRRRTLGHGAVVALVLVGCTGGDDAGGSAFELFGDDPSFEQGPATTTPGIVADDTGDAGGADEVVRPDVEQVGCATLLDDPEIEILLGLDELPYRERAYFEVIRGERCAYEWTEDSTRTALLEPGLPADLDGGAELLGTTGTAVDAVGERAAWFGSAGEGLLAVEAATGLGRLNFRVSLSNPTISDDARLAVAVETARRMLPRFPGVEPPPIPEIDLTATRQDADRRDDDRVQRLIADEAGGADRGELLLTAIEAMVDGAPVDDDLEGFAASMTGVVGLARQYVTEGDDREIAATLDALLADLFPTREQLERAEIGPPTPTTTSTTTSTTSTTVVVNGFRRFPAPTGCDEPTSGYGCIVTIHVAELDEAYGDGKYVLFANDDPPTGFIGWSNDDFGMLIEALTKSAEYFEAHGDMPPTSVLAAPNGTGLIAASPDPDQCTVIVYPDITSYTEAHVKQFVAGQLAHCFLATTYAPTTGSYDPNLWWTAGAAIWLSNEVYPNANLEWVHLPTPLSNHELTTSILQRNQTNAFWFQHLRWAYGTESLLELMTGLPLGASMSMWPGLEQHLLDYVKSLSDLGVPDSGGNLMAGSYQPEAQRFEVDSPLSLLDQVDAFRVDRIELVVTPGEYACLEGELSGGAFLEWRAGERRETGNWSADLPSSLDGAAVFVASSIRDGGFVRITVTDVVDDPDDCEPDDDGGTVGADGADECDALCGSSEFYSTP